ncbi:MAG: hypothetical protein GX320_07590 [Tissierellia bacterium]|nr:hypothetical protein [Tissierellia bacterium]
MKNKQKNKELDKNFFKAMNYEIAAEHGIIDNEDMKKNRKLNSKNKKNQKKNKK